MFPITFIASTFVPIDKMPTLLKVFAQWNPVTTLADAVRIAFGNPNTPLQPGDPFPLQHPFVYTMIWVVALVLICAPLSIRLYQRSLAK
jgi:ABC-2 type transport system permease protein